MNQHYTNVNESPSKFGWPNIYGYNEVTIFISERKYRYVCEYLNIYLYIYKYLKDNIQFSKRSTCYMVNNKYIPTLGTYLYHTHKSNKVKLSNINLSVKRARM